MTQVVINEDPIRERRIGLYVEENSMGEFDLFEVMEMVYVHPNTEGMGYTRQTQERFVKTVNKYAAEAAPLILLFASTVCTEELFKLSPKEWVELE